MRPQDGLGSAGWAPHIGGGGDPGDPNFTNAGARSLPARGRLILILILILPLATAPPPAALAASALALDPSPYVQERARDLVSWRAWEQASLDEARRRDQPVFMLIGDPACLECRAGEREAFGDADAARLVNAAFVGVVVDAFDRPDLASLYAAVLDAPGAARGRSLAVFLLPDGRPFAAHAGLALEDRAPSPGLKTLALRRLSDFQHDRTGVEAAAARNLARLQRAQAAEAPRGPLGRDVVDAALKGLSESFDVGSGGFGPAGAVPPGAPRLLLDEHARTANAAALRMATASLDLLVRREDPAMLLWREALLLRALAQSYAATGSPAHRAAAEARASRVLGHMRDTRGGFVAMRAAGPAGADDRVLAGWNGLMIGALATSGSLLQRPSDLEAAAEAAARLQERLGPVASLRHSVLGTVPGGSAFLDDYVCLADGLLDLHAATGEGRWLADAVALTEAAVGRFGDARGGGFFTTDAAHDPSPVRIKHAFDAPLPSGNGVTARVLLRLDRATGEKRYRELARATIDAFRGDLQRAPRGMETLVGAAAELMAGGEGNRAIAAARSSRQVVGPVTVEASLSSDRVRPGGSLEARVVLRIGDGWRVVAREPGVKDLFGLTASVLGDWLATPGPRYPEPRREPGPWNTGAVAVHAGEAVITVPVRVDRRAAPGERVVGLRIGFQACDASGCKPPRSAHLEVPITVESGP
jgi:uncharacterized protein YyaL (SSP411 family)